MWSRCTHNYCLEVDHTTETSDCFDSSFINKFCFNTEKTPIPVRNTYLYKNRKRLLEDLL